MTLHELALILPEYGLSMDDVYVRRDGVVVVRGTSNILKGIRVRTVENRKQPFRFECHLCGAVQSLEGSERNAALALCETHYDGETRVYEVLCKTCKGEWIPEWQG